MNNIQRFIHWLRYKKYLPSPLKIDGKWAHKKIADLLYIQQVSHKSM